MARLKKVAKTDNKGAAGDAGAAAPKEKKNEPKQSHVNFFFVKLIKNQCFLDGLFERNGYDSISSY